jgi:hypothetical protein
MTAASGPRTVQIRSGDVVRVRQVRPDDAPALASAYANLGEQSRYRRFFTAMPELPDHTLKAAVEVDHENHEALVATPLRAAEILAENRAMLGLMSALGPVETSRDGPVVCARVEIAEPPQQHSPDLLGLLLAAARGEIVSIPVLLRRLIQVPDEVTHIVQLPVTALLAALRSRAPAPP